MKARPPPIWFRRGKCIRVKLVGVKLFKTDGEESTESQVSERVRMSIFSVTMKSCKTAGLSRSVVMEDAERMLR